MLFRSAKHAPRPRGAQGRQQFQAVVDEAAGAHRGSVGRQSPLARPSDTRMNLPFKLPLEPSRDKGVLRKQL